MAPAAPSTSLFSAPHGFFDAALLYNQRDQAFAAPVDIELDPVTVGFSSLQVQAPSVAAPEVGKAGGEDLSLQSWVCHGCRRAVFQSLDEQRAHFKSDFHKFNVKRKLAGKEPFTEDEFDEVALGNGDDEVSSISGSDTETEEDNSAPQGPRSNHVYVKFPDSGSEVIRLWRCLLAADREVLPGEKGYAIDDTAEESSSLKEGEFLRRLRALTSQEGKSLWIILLAAGGHFAGLVLNSRDGSVLAHKTFHRYVVRAKAGGRQSTHDATGRAPHSAGASLRRYNEQALQKEIRELLTSWSEHFDAASHIFVYAPSSNAKTLYGSEDVILDRNDRRIRRIPFTTRRPTMKEAKRISLMLSLLQRLDADSLPVTANIPVSVGRSNKLAAIQEQESRSQTGKSSKHHHLEDIVATEQGGGIGVDQEEELGQGLTPLHEASKAGDVEQVLKLLEEDADPCIKDKGGRTPYGLARDKETRNVFRRFMARHPDKWDWQSASVPSPLTDELEAAQLAKQAEKDAKRKAKEKERKKLKKAQEKDKQAQAEAKAAEAAAEAAAKAAAASVRYDKDRVKEMYKGISLDPKSKEYQEAMLKAQAQERETRAAAAEFRLRALARGSAKPPDSTANISSSSASVTVCSCCGASLVGKVPFTRYSYKYCSTTCVRVHKMALEEEKQD